MHNVTRYTYKATEKSESAYFKQQNKFKLGK